VTAADRQRGAVRACAFVLFVLFCFAASAAAQSKRTPPRPPKPTRPTPHAGSIELSGGALWQGGFDLGTVNAELERNPTTGTGPLDLFAAGSKLGSGIGFQGRVAAYLSTHLAIEGGVRVTRPKLAIKLSGDFESAPDQTATETLTQYAIDGSAVWNLAPFHHGRVVPFIAGGAGYIRDLHEGSELMETGIEYHGLVGLKWWFSDRPHRLGIRGEGGFSIRDGGFDFRDERRTVPIAAAGLVYIF
jgi:hypothetical protein